MFAAVALVVATTDPVPGDRAAVEWVHDTVGTDLDDPARAVGLTATAWTLVPVALALAVWCAVRRRWWALVLVAITAATVWLGNPALKRAFTRDRPDVRDFVEPTSRYTFPSGHAVAAAAFATLVVLLVWPTRARWPVTVGAVVWVVAVGASRLILGVHYPTDLVAGGALGVAVVAGTATWALARRPATADRTSSPPPSATG